MRLSQLPLIPILTLSAFAQDAEVPAIPGIVAPPPAGQVPPPAAEEPAPAPAADLGDTLIKESIEELKLSGQALADLYRLYTGRRVIVSSAASQAEFQFIQYASAQDPLTYRQAAELLRRAATIENFIFVPAVNLPNVDFLTLATSEVKPQRLGLNLYTENDPLPEGDSVISYMMPLSFLKPEEAMRVFQQIVGQFGAYGSITTSGSSVVITENTSLIRKLIELKAQIDKPSSQVATRFIDVKFADVTELATTLNELIGNQSSTTTTAGVQRTPQINPAINPANVAVAVDGSASAGQETPVQVIPDSRTNRIFAMGRPVDLLFVEGLVREFDIESDQRNFLRRKLKFLAVADFLPIAGDALTRAFTGTGTSEGSPQAQAQTGGGSNRQSTRQQSNGSLFNNSGGSQQGNSFGGNSGFGGSGGRSSGSRGNSLSDPQVNSAPESLLIGRTLLVADNITNSIVVQGPPSGVEIIEKLLDQVDVKADQVMISTVFGQLSLGDSTTTGVDWLRAFRGGENGGVAGSSINGGTANNFDPSGLLSPFTGTAAGTFPNQIGLSLYGKIGNSLNAYVNLLSSNSNFTVLSRPSIFTANNRKGTISSGRRIAVPTNSNQFGGSSGVSTNIEYRDVVLKLEVIPLVNSENEITLQIALVSDDVIGQSDAIEGIGSVPIIGTRELLTTVTVPNNQTIVLGGLITSNDTEDVTGIPILSDIPGLGRLFSKKTKGIERDELMIFIQPSIVNSGNSLDYVQADMDSRFDVSGEARKFADGSVLPPLDPVANEKGTSRADTRIPAAVPVNEKERSKSIRPIHRR